MKCKLFIVSPWLDKMCINLRPGWRKFLYSWAWWIAEPMSPPQLSPHTAAQHWSIFMQCLESMFEYHTHQCAMFRCWIARNLTLYFTSLEINTFMSLFIDNSFPSCCFHEYLMLIKVGPITCWLSTKHFSTLSVKYFLCHWVTQIFSPIRSWLTTQHMCVATLLNVYKSPAHQNVALLIVLRPPSVIYCTVHWQYSTAQHSSLQPLPHTPGSPDQLSESSPIRKWCQWRHNVNCQMIK